LPAPHVPLPLAARDGGREDGHAAARDAAQGDGRQRGAALPRVSAEQLPGLGAIDQLSFAVPSVDDALPRYETMFGGPFTAMDVPGMDVVVRGQPETVSLRLGFGQTAGLEVELVEVVAGGWPTVAWLAEHGEGLHHVRYPVDDYAGSRDRLQAA